MSMPPISRTFLKEAPDSLGPLSGIQDAVFDKLPVASFIEPFLIVSRVQIESFGAQVPKLIIMHNESLQLRGSKQNSHIHGKKIKNSGSSGCDLQTAHCGHVTSGRNWEVMRWVSRRGRACK